jgi:DNA polymerase II
MGANATFELNLKSESKTLQGLILTRQWHDSGSGQSLVYWLATNEGPVRLEFTEQESVFFIPASSVPRVEPILAAELRWRSAPVELRCFSQTVEPATACYFRNQRDLGLARALLQKHDIPTFEADIRPTDRYLMERFVQGTLEVSGDFNFSKGYLAAENPKIRKASFEPGLSVVSLDIETSISNGNILSIAVDGEGVSKVFLLGKPRPTSLLYLEFVDGEAALLQRFVVWFAALDPDAIIGWNVVGFDLKFLQDRAETLGVAFNIGRGLSPVSWRFLDRGQQRVYAVIPGRVILDGIELLRTATYSFESFSLENVARELLGRGKLVHDVDSRAFEIENMHRTDQESLARYNLEDCTLVLDIFKHADLIDFAIRRSCLTGLEMDRQGGSVAAFDFLYLPKLHRAGFVAPVVDEETVVHSPGGYVLDSLPGLYRDVIVLDFKSLYPSIIRTFHVDPLAMIKADEDRIPGFLEASFSKNHHILPDIIEELWQARDKAKKDGDAAGSQAIKIIMNSFYGVLGTPGCRFFDPRLASSITLRGHEILQKTRDLIQDEGYSVIYGDTDSVFVLLDQVEGDVKTAGSRLAGYLNDWWTNELRNRYGIPSNLEIEFETHFEKFFMPTIRGSEKGSKKRYAGMVRDDSGKSRLIFKGLESVRSDWSPLAREFQIELYRRVFMDEPHLTYIRETAERLLKGELDEKLSLRRRLRRKLNDYTKNVPPHVRAARLADTERVQRGLKPTHEHGGWIEYRMTVNGPEPLPYVNSAIDYDFYMDRQLAPIADAILGLEGSSLGLLMDKQMGLFE